MTPGSYISQTPDISHYYQYMLAIKKLRKEPKQENLIIHAMMLDFMAFTAQTFRRLLCTLPSSAAQLQAIRNIMIMSIQLKTMDASQNSDEFSVLCYVHPTIDLKTGL